MSTDSETITIDCSQQQQHSSTQPHSSSSTQPHSHPVAKKRTITSALLTRHTMSAGARAGAAARFWRQIFCAIHRYRTYTRYRYSSKYIPSDFSRMVSRDEGLVGGVVIECRKATACTNGRQASLTRHGQPLPRKVASSSISSETLQYSAVQYSAVQPDEDQCDGEGCASISVCLSMCRCVCVCCCVVVVLWCCGVILCLR